MGDNGIQVLGQRGAEGIEVRLCSLDTYYKICPEVLYLVKFDEAADPVGRIIDIKRCDKRSGKKEHEKRSQ